MSSKVSDCNNSPAVGSSNQKSTGNNELSSDNEDSSDDTSQDPEKIELTLTDNTTAWQLMQAKKKRNLRLCGNLDYLMKRINQKKKIMCAKAC